MRNLFQPYRALFNLSLILGSMALVGYACNSTSGNVVAEVPAQALPVITIQNAPATTYQDYSASLEGKKDIEIRPRVDGYLQKIYVDEGAYVREGQLLFKIDDRIYRDQLNNAKAGVASAKANLASAQINVSRLTPLVQNNVVSEVQLKTAQAAYDAALANVSQAESMVANAQTNIGYTVIKAPVSGYIGRIPFKTGSAVGVNTSEALTMLSEIREIYAYFSLSENDFLQFKNEFPGNTIEEKIKQFPPVELILADNSVYSKKGRVQTISGQFNNSTGSITLRAGFENEGGLLRSGNTGKIRIPKNLTSALIVPQEATFELQNKVFVFLVSDSNTVSSSPINIVGSSGNFYLIDKGLKSGDKIVFSGLDRLREGAHIRPEPISMDSLLKSKPL